MENRLQKLAEMMGTSEADVLLFAQLTVTQMKAGKQDIEAIKAASETMTELCNSAFRNKDGFADIMYDMVAA